MTEYFELLEELNKNKEENFADFQRKLIPTKQKILGVRTPTMRILAKSYQGEIEKLLSFPDEYYEVTFIKLIVVSSLPYERFVLYVENCVSLIDNWATCDCFKAKCIAKRKDEFLPVLERIYKLNNPFAQRYVLVTLLFSYVEDTYLPLIRKYIEQTPTDEYYLHMAVAWLTAEILVKRFEKGVEILQDKILPIKTHNKAIQKAIESYRLTHEQKEFLRSLKIKNK